MNKEQEDLLVRQFYGCSTRIYTDLETVFLNSTNYVIRDALLGDPPIIGLKTSDFPLPDGTSVPMFYSGDVIACRIKDSNFRKNDLFHLTTYGENLLYQLKKEDTLIRQADKTLFWAKMAFWATVLLGLLGLLNR